LSDEAKQFNIWQKAIQKPTGGFADKDD
jgi:hypothetical protein